MMKHICVAAIMGLVLSMTANAFAQLPPLDDMQKQVMETERAFAQTMADRDFQAFQSFLADETVFFAGETPLNGKQAVVNAWKGFYESEATPFSWAPAQVVVLESGTLALSTGPVHDPTGKQVATFTSIWRQEAPGLWKIVFDKGCKACVCTED